MTVKKVGAEELWHLMTSDGLMLLGLWNVLKNKELLMKEASE